MIIGLDQALWGVLLVLVNAGITYMLHLRLAKTLIWITLRGGVQLLMLGWLLQWIFMQPSMWVVGAIGVGMVALASQAAIGRCKHRFRGIYLQSMVSMGLSALVIVGLGLTVILHADPWYDPKVAIPIMGMIIGNSLNAIALAMDRLLEDLMRDRAAIETKLALGATRWEAAHTSLCTAIRTGLVPIINLMTVVGVVSLPGTMTGLLLGGTDPLSAVMFQFLILILIMTCTVLATIGMVFWTYHRLFHSEHRCDVKLLQPAKR